MASKEWFEQEQLINTPRGNYIRKEGVQTTVPATKTNIVTHTVSTDKVFYLTGLNWIDRAHIDTLHLVIDGSDTTKVTLLKPMAGADVWSNINNINPPIKCASSCSFAVTDDGTSITDFRAVIEGYEADQ